MRILIDCTFVYHHPHLHTGIQRVVRSVAARAGNAHPVECVPVVVEGANMRRIVSLMPLPATVAARWLLRFNQLEPSLHRWIGGCWNVHERYERAFNKPRLLSRAWWWGCRIASAPAVIALRTGKRLQSLAMDDRRSKPLTPEPGDALVLLDANWTSDYKPVVDRCHALGVHVVAIIYDLIPLSHPQFCISSLIREFDRWFRWVAGAADGYVAISATIRDEVQAKIADMDIQRPVGRPAPWFDFFHLGTELDKRVAGAEPDKVLAQLFGKFPVYLMVGTIEPRKNHAYLLDAFELAWAAGENVALCIIGRSGWKNDALMRRIEKHAEFGKRLYVFGDASDADLDYAYAHARALVFASIVEGFGLPLVEGMQRGLPSMVSDIPVFREIGQDSAAYFDLARPQTLADLVHQFESSGIFPAQRPLKDWSWVDWDGATAQLVDTIVKRYGTGDGAVSHNPSTTP